MNNLAWGRNAHGNRGPGPGKKDQRSGIRRTILNDLSHGLRTPNAMTPFLLKSQTFGIGLTNLRAIGEFSVKLLAPILLQ